LPGRPSAAAALNGGQDIAQEPFTLVGAAVANPLSHPGHDEPEFPDSGGHAEERPATTPHGLPRRVRPDNFDAPDDFTAATPAGTPPVGRHRSATPTQAPAPDDARRLAASLQSGWQRREAAEDDSDAEAVSDPWDIGHAVEQAWPPQHTEEES
jgi:hypothetical protein